MKDNGVPKPLLWMKRRRFSQFQAVVEDGPRGGSGAVDDHSLREAIDLNQGVQTLSRVALCGPAARTEGVELPSAAVWEG